MQTVSMSDQVLEYREREYLKYLRIEGKLVPSAKNLRLNQCQRCGYCCLGVSCVPKPDEVESIANFLELSTDELFKHYMMIDKFDDSNYFLRFANENQQDITGTYLPKERWFDRGYCILYDKKNRICRIYPVRPSEARDWKCWDIKPTYIKAASIWKPKDIYKILPHFHTNINIDGIVCKEI